MNLRPSILIVDDHADIRDPLTDYLRRFDFEVESAVDGQDMRRRLERRSYDLILLDVMLPGENGLSLCRHVSERIGTPVVLLTAVSEQADKVAGLEVGADDYVVKPFDPRELVARIRSVLRRARAEAVTNEQERQNRAQMIFSGWTLDVEARELRDPRQKVVSIGTAEYHLLRAFLDNPFRVLSRSHLLDLTQRANSEVFDRSIDSQISRLRKKLEADPRHPTLLKTVRGDGYLFATSVTSEPA
ncbi:TPA: response regulator [Stenotrophomonas maltophilia]